MEPGKDFPRINQVVVRVRQVRWSPSVAPCDRCSQAAKRVSDATRTAIDVDLDHPVLLQVIVSVHCCQVCQHFFRAQPPFLRSDATYTNRVVAKAVASVHEDGMAVRRVAHRLARDFWVRPSERMIRVWSHHLPYARPARLALVPQLHRPPDGAQSDDDSALVARGATVVGDGGDRVRTLSLAAELTPQQS